MYFEILYLVLQQLSSDASLYDGFNLVLVDAHRGSATCLSNKPRPTISLRDKNGNSSVFINISMSTESTVVDQDHPKIKHGQSLLDSAIADYDYSCCSDWKQASQHFIDRILRDQVVTLPAADSHRSHFSKIFVPPYQLDGELGGTRSSLVILIEKPELGGTVYLLERDWISNTDTTLTTSLPK